MSARSELHEVILEAGKTRTYADRLIESFENEISSTEEKTPTEPVEIVEEEAPKPRARRKS